MRRECIQSGAWAYSSFSPPSHSWSVLRQQKISPRGSQRLARINNQSEPQGSRITDGDHLAIRSCHGPPAPRLIHFFRGACLVSTSGERFWRKVVIHPQTASRNREGMSRALIISEPGSVAVCGIRSHKGFTITIPGLSFRYTRATRLGVKADDACCSDYLWY